MPVPSHGSLQRAQSIQELRNAGADRAFIGALEPHGAERSLAKIGRVGARYRCQQGRLAGSIVDFVVGMRRDLEREAEGRLSQSEQVDVDEITTGALLRQKPDTVQRIGQSLGKSRIVDFRYQIG